MAGLDRHVDNKSNLDTLKPIQIVLRLRQKAGGAGYLSRTGLRSHYFDLDFEIGFLTPDA
jgi:hypothetical protein